ncbi:MoaD/ThiS family protein [Thermodesulfobacteriota bacterium]
MNVKLKFFYTFTRYYPPESVNGADHICIDCGMTVQGLLDKLGLPPQIPRTVLVNGVRACDDALLQESDSIAVFPPMAGG